MKYAFLSKILKQISSTQAQAMKMSLKHTGRHGCNIYNLEQGNL